MSAVASWKRRISCAALDELLVGEDLHRLSLFLGPSEHLPVDVGQDLASFLVDPEKARRSIEANSCEVAEKGVDELGVPV